MTILLVEDSPDDVFFFRRAVKKAEISADTQVASDGLEAIRRLTKPDPAQPPGIIFLDLKLPHINGFELLQWIRERPELQVPPIVVLTSSDEPEDRDKAASLGASLFLTKPPAPDQLRDVFHKILGQHS
ncbi:MAG TPA: response regulator [Verrucomicrobiae bacterium]|jgi:CheY-like chemotaxis protein|nr:response regulator [Verrucomicrobiae bacterium]